MTTVSDCTQSLRNTEGNALQQYKIPLCNDDLLGRCLYSDLAGKAVGVPVAAHAHVVGVEGEDGLQAGGGAGGGAHLHTQPFYDCNSESIE